MIRQCNRYGRFLWLGLTVLCGFCVVACKQKAPPPDSLPALPNPPRLRTQEPLSRPAIPLNPEQRKQRISQAMQQILGGKKGENSQLLLAMNQLRSSKELQQEAIPLLVRQLRWESGRRACHLLVALYELTKSAQSPLSAQWAPSAKREKPSIRNLDCSEGIQLKHINLDNFQLNQAKLPQAHLAEASLQRVDLSQAQLNKANLRAAQLTGSNLQKAQFSHSNLTQAGLASSDLRSAQLPHATLVGSRLERADLRFANLQYADLSAALLLRANLRKADLRHARLLKAQIQGVQWQGTQLQGTLFSASARKFLRSLRRILRKSVCVRDTLLQPCGLWRSALSSASSGSVKPSVSCPSTPLRGPVFVFSQTEFDDLSSRQQKKLRRFRCP